MLVNKFGYDVTIQPIGIMSVFNLGELVEFIQDFNFPICDQGEELYCSSHMNCGFDLKIREIDKENKTVTLVATYKYVSRETL